MNAMSNGPVERRKTFARILQAQVGAIEHAGALQVIASGLVAGGVDLEGDHLPIGGQRPRDVQSGHPDRRPDLDDAGRAAHPGQQAQQLAGLRGHHRDPVPLRLGLHLGKHLIGLSPQLGQVFVDFLCEDHGQHDSHPIVERRPRST